MSARVERFDATRRDDFYAVHCEANGEGWCNCVAWWVPTWDGWGERTAGETRALRDRLCDQGQYDGYLLYVDDAPAGWCQVGPRDRLQKLCSQFAREPDPEVWAITCFTIAPPHRRQGLAGFMLSEVLDDLRTRGVKSVEAFPKRGEDLQAGHLWTGPEAMYRRVGFTESEDPSAPFVLRLELF